MIIFVLIMPASWFFSNRQCNAEKIAEKNFFNLDCHLIIGKTGLSLDYSMEFTIFQLL